MSNYSIPFNLSSLEGRELEYIQHTIATGQISGDQDFSRKCQDFLELILGVKHALITTSCTHSLEMAAILLGIAPGDEIIVPSFTFVSTPNAFVMRGAKPIFCDIRRDTLNLDESKLEALITPNTKAIIPVHYAGVGCEMDAILEIAARKGIPVVEDNAHGLFGKYKGRYLGTFGCMATQSFHATKNITCGEGGALLINDESYVLRAEIIREKGTNRSRFFRGEVDKYTWVDIGSSYVISDILAAFLYGQLEMCKIIQEKRKRIWQCYNVELARWSEQNGVLQPVIPSHCEQAWHMYYLLLPSLEKRSALIDHLRTKGINSVFHYQSLHMSEFGSRFGAIAGDCPVTEDVSNRLLRLPFYGALTDKDQAYVINAIHDFRC
ncbi:MAG: dTDP-4-amino-4,6-dideoxygalactose transaminase [Nitrosomonadaceae bacterium]|nr:dTDP-4-amino-4,6-dideoxygalactose transaminase [Nitrosomonadaceae bacterium]